MRTSRFLGNAALAAGTVLEHLGEDPVVLALQISRRLPERVVHPLAEMAGKVAGRGVAGPLSALVLGDLAGAERQLEVSAEAGTAGRRALRMADVATAAGLDQLADRLLAGAGSGASGLPGTTARRRWHAGNMSGAVAALATGNAGERRQQRRLAAELAVFQGWRPQLVPVAGYSPDEATVLHVLTNSLPHTGSGYAQRSHSILKAQHQLGWTVHAVTRPGYPVAVGKLFADFEDRLEGVTYHRLLPARLPFGLQNRLQQQAELTLALALRIRPAVLHTTTHFVNGLVTAAVAEALGIPWVYEVRGQLADTWASKRSENARDSQRYRLFREREADVMQRAALVPTLGSVMAGEIVGVGIAPNRIRLLPNSVGDSFLQQPLPAAEARRRLALDPDTELIGTVSSLVDYEGLDDLITAFALISDRNPNLKCLIVGDGASGPRLQALAAELGIAGRVIFTGRVPREQAHLHHQALDVFVVPRKDFNVTRAVTPLKPVEAMACARPVIASALPALAELVQDGITGRLVPASNPERLADVIGSLIANPGLRSDLGTAGRRQVLAERTWPSVAAATLEMYKDIRQES